MLSDDIETAQTVALMDELAARDAGKRSVIEATQQALDEAGVPMTGSAIDKTRAVYWWIKRHVRYVPTPGTSPLVDQTLIPPATLLSMPEPIGDCPQYSMLASAMLRACCVSSQFKTIAAEKSAPGIYSHVYNVVEISPGRFYPFDASNGPAPGAEYSRPLKSRVWPAIAPNRCRPRIARRKEPMLRTENHSPAGWRNVSLRGTMEGEDDTGNSDTYSYTDSGVQSQTDAAANAAGYAALYPNGTGSSSTSFATTLVNDATALAAPLIKAATAQKPYLIAGPNGTQVLYNPNTGGTSAAGGVTAALSSPTTLLLLAAGVAFFALSSKK